MGRNSVCLSFRLSVQPAFWPPEGQLEGSEGQLEGSEGLLEGSEGLLEGSEGWLEGSLGQPAGSEGLPEGGRTNGRTDRTLGAAAQNLTFCFIQDTTNDALHVDSTLPGRPARETSRRPFSK